jgi:hypothetical protein
LNKNITKNNSKFLDIILEKNELSIVGKIYVGSKFLESFMVFDTMQP